MEVRATIGLEVTIVSARLERQVWCATWRMLVHQIPVEPPMLYVKRVLSTDRTNVAVQLDTLGISVMKT